MHFQGQMCWKINGLMHLYVDPYGQPLYCTEKMVARAVKGDSLIVAVAEMVEVVSRWLLPDATAMCHAPTCLPQDGLVTKFRNVYKTSLSSLH